MQELEFETCELWTSFYNGSGIRYNDLFLLRLSFTYMLIPICILLGLVADHRFGGRAPCPLILIASSFYGPLAVSGRKKNQNSLTSWYLLLSGVIRLSHAYFENPQPTFPLKFSSFPWHILCFSPMFAEFHIFIMLYKLMFLAIPFFLGMQPFLQLACTPSLLHPSPNWACSRNYAKPCK